MNVKPFKQESCSDQVENMNLKCTGCWQTDGDWRYNGSTYPQCSAGDFTNVTEKNFRRAVVFLEETVFNEKYTEGN